MKASSPLENSQSSRPGVLTFHLPAETIRSLGAKVPDGVNVLICPPEQITPVYIRLPKGGKGSACPVTGLPRSSLIDLIKASGGRIKTHKLKKRGHITGGSVLIERQSLIAYIESQPPAEWSESEEPEANEKPCHL